MTAAASAQTVNPSTVSFLPSPDHDAVDSSGQPIVSGYDLEFFPAGGAQSQLVLHLGKPSPGADGYISVDFASMLSSPPSPGQQLDAKVAAVGPGGTAESGLSNTFVFDCTASVSPASVSVPAGGGSGSVTVSAFTGCGWQATSGASWITITSATGAGDGTVAFSAQANTLATTRVGTITVAGQSVAVSQPGSSTPTNIKPTVQVTSPATGTSYTAPATITIAATAADSDGTIAGVAFYANGTPVGSAASAPYAFTWSNVAAGNYSITAAATDNSGATTTSSAVSVAVSAPNVPPTVQVTSPAAGATFTAPATITVSADARDSDGTVTGISLYANGTLLGTATASPASMSWSNVAAGTYAITAVATDNSGAKTTSSAVSITVNGPNVAPTVQLTGPANGATFTAPASIAITANATDSDGTINRVTFYANGTAVGTASASPYSFTWTNVPAGSYAITALATDNSGATTASSAANVTVKAPNVAPTVQLTAPASGAVFTAPASVAMTANAVDSDGTISRVIFYANGAAVGTASGSPYSFTWTNVPAGTYTITAAATDNSGATTTSSGVSVAVQAPPNVAPTVQLTSPTDGTTFIAPASIALVANAADSDGTVSAVSFYANGILVGRASASPYTVTWSNVAVGSYTITAVATDNSGAQTTSAAVTVRVARKRGKK